MYNFPFIPQQTNGFVSVRSVEEAFNYPIAPGNSITFKDETAPFVYTKTKGFSPLEQPVFERYRLVKVEEPISPSNQPVQPNIEADEIKRIWNEINALKGQITTLEKGEGNEPDGNGVQAVHEQPRSILG